jgi:hypothetical protein
MAEATQKDDAPKPEPKKAAKPAEVKVQKPKTYESDIASAYAKGIDAQNFKIKVVNLPGTINYRVHMLDKVSGLEKSSRFVAVYEVDQGIDIVDKTIAGAVLPPISIKFPPKPVAATAFADGGEKLMATADSQ